MSGTCNLIKFPTNSGKVATTWINEFPYQQHPKLISKTHIFWVFSLLRPATSSNGPSLFTCIRSVGCAPQRTAQPTAACAAPTHTAQPTAACALPWTLAPLTVANSRTWLKAHSAAHSGIRMAQGSSQVLTELVAVQAPKYQATSPALPQFSQSVEHDSQWLWCDLHPWLCFEQSNRTQNCDKMLPDGAYHICPCPLPRAVPKHPNKLHTDQCADARFCLLETLCSDVCMLCTCLYPTQNGHEDGPSWHFYNWSMADLQCTLAVSRPWLCCCGPQRHATLLNRHLTMQQLIQKNILLLKCVICHKICHISAREFWYYVPCDNYLCIH